VFFFGSTLALVKNHFHEWNTFTSWSIDWKVLLLFVVICHLFNNSFFIIFIYLDIEFIKPSDDVKIQRKTITFTKDRYPRTVFVNKMINSGIMRMFIFFFNFHIYIFYFVSQVLCICTNNRSFFSIRNIFFYYCNDFIFLLFNNLMRYWHCIWIKTRGPQRWLVPPL
jgi:hypothetical protein